MADNNPPPPLTEELLAGMTEDDIGAIDQRRVNAYVANFLEEHDLTILETKALPFSNLSAKVGLGSKSKKMNGKVKNAMKVELVETASRKVYNNRPRAQAQHNVAGGAIVRQPLRLLMHPHPHQQVGNYDPLHHPVYSARASLASFPASQLAAQAAREEADRAAQAAREALAAQAAREEADRVARAQEADRVARAQAAQEERAERVAREEREAQAAREEREAQAARKAADLANNKIVKAIDQGLEKGFETIEKKIEASAMKAGSTPASAAHGRPCDALTENDTEETNFVIKDDVLLERFNREGTKLIASTSRTRYWKQTDERIKNKTFKYPSVLEARDEDAASDIILGSLSPEGSSTLGLNTFIAVGKDYSSVAYFKENNFVEGEDEDDWEEERAVKAAMAAINLTSKWVYTIELTVNNEDYCAEIVLFTKSELDGKELHGALFGTTQLPGVKRMEIEGGEGGGEEGFGNSAWAIDRFSFSNALLNSQAEQVTFTTIDFLSSLCTVLHESGKMDYQMMAFNKCEFSDGGKWLTHTKFLKAVEFSGCGDVLRFLQNSATLKKVCFGGALNKDDIEIIKGICTADSAWLIQKGHLGSDELSQCSKILMIKDTKTFKELREWIEGTVVCKSRGRIPIRINDATGRPCAMCKRSGSPCRTCVALMQLSKDS